MLSHKVVSRPQLRHINESAPEKVSIRSLPLGTDFALVALGEQRGAASLRAKISVALRDSDQSKKKTVILTIRTVTSSVMSTILPSVVVQGIVVTNQVGSGTDRRGIQ